MQTLKMSQKLIALNKLPFKTDFYIQKHFFNYNQWYKIESERHRRTMEKKNKFFKNNTIFDILKLLIKETNGELTKFYYEFKEELSNDYK